MSGNPDAPTPIEKTLTEIQAEHSRRLKKLEDIVGPPPPPGSPNQYHTIHQQLDGLQKELTLVSRQFTRMERLEREIAELRADLRRGQLGQTQQRSS